MKKYKYLFISAAVSAVLLCGCGSELPEMSEVEEAVITEYATNLLVKHSTVGERALLNDDELEAGIAKEAEERERLLKTKEMEKVYLQAAENGEVVTDEADAANSELEEDTVTVEEVVPQKTVSEFFAEDSISIDYTSYSLCNSYPENNGEDFFMSMDAASGKQLCVVKFSVKNLSGSEQSLDMLNKQGRFSLKIDGGKTIQAESTLLIDDLSAYSGMIPANGEEQMVLVFEVPAELSQIGSMDLLMSDASGENTLTLQ